MIKAVIFDFDGLILDTETAWYKAYKEVFGRYGVDLTLDFWGKTIGTVFNIDEVIRYLQDRSGRTVDKDQINAETKNIFLSIMENLELRPGVLRYLNEAKRLGLSVGLASSSRLASVEPYLIRYGIRPYFDVLVTRDRVTKVKPDPELYVTALKELGVAGRETIAFEDSLNGLRAAKSADVHCVIVPNEVTAHMNFEGYAMRLSSMEEMDLEALARQILSTAASNGDKNDGLT